MKMLAIVFLFSFMSLFCQKSIYEQAKLIEDEGRKLYKLEMASWYGTDIFRDKYTNNKDVGGYFSYIIKDSIRCIYFSNYENPKVIGSFTFDTTFNLTTTSIDLSERDFTKFEFDLYEIRQKSKVEVFTDTLFKHFKITNFNLIPIVEIGTRKVYILTAPIDNKVIIFGNDYLLEFDYNNNLLSKKKLHNNIISIENDTNTVFTYHGHNSQTGDLITATDICTILLYNRFTKWKYHAVMGKDYVSVWDYRLDKLFIFTKEEWLEDINKKGK
ncbi:MAG: hypothetical protein V1779_16030 [bacterium]